MMKDNDAWTATSISRLESEIGIQTMVNATWKATFFERLLEVSIRFKSPEVIWHRDRERTIPQRSGHYFPMDYSATRLSEMKFALHLCPDFTFPNCSLPVFDSSV
jgi:hypothetical protein